MRMKSRYLSAASLFSSAFPVRRVRPVRSPHAFGSQVSLADSSVLYKSGVLCPRPPAGQQRPRLLDHPHFP